MEAEELAAWRAIANDTKPDEYGMPPKPVIKIERTKLAELLALIPEEAS